MYKQNNQPTVSNPLEHVVSDDFLYSEASGCYICPKCSCGAVYMDSNLTCTGCGLKSR